jgi:hypothetical protein
VAVFDVGGEVDYDRFDGLSVEADRSAFGLFDLDGFSASDKSQSTTVNYLSCPDNP